MLSQILVAGIVKSQGPQDENDPGLKSAVDTGAAAMESTSRDSGDPIVKRGNIEHTANDAA